MARSSLLPLRTPQVEIGIYSDRSSLVLFWLLVNHLEAKQQGFSINALARNTELSVGLVHKVIRQLEYNGVIVSEGFRTNKKFHLKSPDQLLFSWIQQYNVLKKTKVRGFSFSSADQPDLNSSKWGLLPALHSAATEYFHSKSTNLRSQEYYILKWDKLPQLVTSWKLLEMDRGYEILFIKPYYSNLIKKVSQGPAEGFWQQAYALLTVLDLCHFPLRGAEQAESLFRKTDFLKSICSWREIENVLG